MPNRNRTAGHNYERNKRKEFREDLGWSDCETARYASREVDDSAVDFVRTKPFNFQAKYAKQRPNFWSLLDEDMPKDDNYNAVLFKKNTGRGGKKQEYAVIKWEDFKELIDILKTNNLI